MMKICLIVMIYVIWIIAVHAIEKPHPVQIRNMEKAKEALKAYYAYHHQDGKRFNVGNIMPNETKGCITNDKPYPQVYKDTPAPGFDFEDKAAVAASANAIVNKFVDLRFGTNQTKLATLVMNTTHFGIWITEEKNPRILVAFATTTPIVSDFRAWPTKCSLKYRDMDEFDCGEAHTGFFKKYESEFVDVIDNYIVISKKQQINEIIFTGGSQGAAVGLIASLHAKFLFPSMTIKLINFAAPEFFYTLPKDQLPSLDRFVRYAASYVAAENDPKHPNYFCVDDVVVLPTAITDTFNMIFKHIHPPTYVPCNAVTPDGKEGPTPPPKFVYKDLFQINWMCHEAQYYLSRFVFWDEHS